MMDLTRAASSGDPPAVPLHTLTTQQRRIVETVDAIEAATGEPCPARQVARRLRVDESTVRGHLDRLYRKGWLKTPNAPISLRYRP